ncbi:L-amino-acid oxidase [Dactylonectria estremocensis]|uniref:L-amino-acid oxidase n=1 Tax=Dactylonectria estremocensis TaxID=1079267 RepID=A0A9P9EVW1_9HYPO|nr:L-amino-acid oxidase [Dactylonectria estremocensis]
MRCRFLLPALGLLSTGSCAYARSENAVSFLSPRKLEQGSPHNVLVEYFGSIDGELTVVYGSCDTVPTPFDANYHIGTTHVGNHPLAKRHGDWIDCRPTSLVWITPSDVSEGCFHAFVNNAHVGRSGKVQVTKRLARRGRKTFADVADPMGPWFDGVAYLKQKQPDDRFVASSKNKTFGILGGGISGLTAGLMLDSVGVHNWKILESSDRIGGRIMTTYLNNTAPEDGQYHELGPMRFPVEITDPDTNDTFPIMDQRMVFQLADVLNEMNASNETLQVKFSNWIQSSPNTPVTTSKRRPDGTFPGKTEVATNPVYEELVHYSNATAAEEAIQALEDFKGLDQEHIRFYATNVFRAHKEAVETGMFDFSEVEYLRHVVGTDLNTTDEVTPSHVVWPMWEYETAYFLASKWATIKGGLSRLPEAFLPIIEDRIEFGTKVNGIKYHENKTLSVTWKPTGSNPFTTTSTTEHFDYVFNTVPFNLLKFWDLPPYSSLMRRAIDRTVFGGAVKVAIQYKTRWWEHLERPVFGGCGRVNSPLIGQICFPSHDLNSTGPGVLMASYISDYDATVACAMSEEDHMAYVQKSLIAIYGDVVQENWTGNYARECWEHNEHHAGAFALPIVPQQQLYLPAFFRTEFNTVFIGEHTSITHSWIFSALESAARGTVQLLLDMGLVDEAKQITETWMARWIQV